MDSGCKEALVEAPPYKIYFRDGELEEAAMVERREEVGWGGVGWGLQFRHLEKAISP